MNRPKKTKSIEVDPNDNLFKRTRIFSGLSQDKLAQVIDVAGSTVRRWEKRDNTIEPSFTVKQLKEFCKIANYNIISELPDSLLNKSTRS